METPKHPPKYPPQHPPKHLADYLTDGPATSKAVVILAHGAGVSMDSPFMDTFAAGVAGAGFLCVRFEFPYMAARRKDGSRRPPDRMPVLMETWRRVMTDVADAFPGLAIFTGGKSMGGRVATMLAAEASATSEASEAGAASDTGQDSDAGKNTPPVHGVICLGYPFHPAGQPEKQRVAHLENTRTPTLIIQGTRDALGNEEEVPGYALSDAVAIHWLADGDHSFKPRKASGRTAARNWQEGIAALTGFVKTHAP